MSERDNWTFRERLQREIATAERSAESTYGNDWFQLSPEEEKVFAIDRKRFRRMVRTWEYYQRIKGFTGGNAAYLKEARAAYPQWCGPGKDRVTDQVEFAEFAMEFGALTMREAIAFFQKYEFWCVRNGIVWYRDEPKD